jgi:thiamine pyrophosphate-dependent acetolactate synthase large subunit-like protein
MTHVYDILAQTFLNEGVTTCFSLLGDANMNWATRMAEGGCRMIYVRHEHCAVAAAMAYARKSGNVGVATTTCGPGLTQVVTALPAAVRAHLPVVVFAGEAPLGKAWYNQGIDQGPVITATGAAYHALHDVARMPTQIRDAFVQARQEQRPVVIGVPFDLQDKVWDGPKTLPAPSSEMLPKVGPIPPHPDDIAAAITLITQSKRIVLMAGLGAVHAVAEAQDLAAKCDALLATSLPARGLFAGEVFNIGIAGGFSSDIARDLLGQADLIVAAGCSLAQHNADSGKLYGQAHVIQIDTKPAVQSQGRVAADSHIRADAALGLAALTAALPNRLATWRTDTIAAAIANTLPDASPRHPEPNVHDPRDVITALEAVLPPDWDLVNSSGHCSYYFAQMPSRPYEKFLTIREFGAIGNGIAFAIGVAAARPKNTVVLFDGDGSALMHIQEIETMRRHGLNILICILNDGAYGSEIHKLRAEGLSDAGAVFGRTDLAAIARGFGAAGYRIDDLTILPQLVKDVAGVTLFDFPVSDKVASPVMRRAHPPKDHSDENPPS